MESASSIVPWSFSKAKAFEQCPKQFYHMKVLKAVRGQGNRSHAVRHTDARGG